MPMHIVVMVTLIFAPTIILSSVYNQGGYVEIVQDMAENSMKAAVDEVKALASYSSAGGEVSCIPFTLSTQ